MTAKKPERQVGNVGLSGTSDTWTVRQAWDRQGRPQRITVTFLRHLYEMTPKHRALELADVRTSLADILAEAINYDK